MWIKVEDTKTIFGTVSAMSLDLDTNEITLTTSGLFTSLASTFILQVVARDPDTTLEEHGVRDSIYLRWRSGDANTSKFQMYWPLTTPVELEGSTTRIKSYTTQAAWHTKTAFKLAKLLGLEGQGGHEYESDSQASSSTLTTSVHSQNIDYAIYKLDKGTSHCWYPISSFNILTVIDGEKHSSLTNNHMFFSTCCSYGYTDHSGDAVGPFGTGESTTGHLGPYYNISNDVSTLLMTCETACGGLDEDTTLIARRVRANQQGDVRGGPRKPPVKPPPIIRDPVRDPKEKEREEAKRREEEARRRKEEEKRKQEEQKKKEEEEKRLGKK